MLIVRVLVRLAKLIRWGLFVTRIRFLAMINGVDLDLKVHWTAEFSGRQVIKFSRGAKVALRIGQKSKVANNVLIRMRGGTIEIGERVDIRENVVLNVGGGCLKILGDNAISWGTVIHCANSVSIKKYAFMGEYVTVVDSSHFYSNPQRWALYNVKSRPVVIGENVWLCPKATVTSGVIIGECSIVASNSCVIRSVDSFQLVSGVPAKVVSGVEMNES